MFIQYNLFGFSWAAVIMVLTVSPGHEMPKTLDWELLAFDTFSHFFVFGLLTLLLIVGFTKQFAYPKLRTNAVISAIGIGIIYGILIEGIQSMIPGRYFAFVDILANSIGCFTGYLAFFLIYKFSFRL